tara:strand:- start:2921 stop:3370 length:450 start_codon:yes stop_codon:yes gene_type:complete
MKKTILLVLLMLTLTFSFGQTKGLVITNDLLIAQYLEEFIDKASQKGYDIQDQLLSKVSYILIAPDNMVIEDLSKIDLDKKLILLDTKVRLDRLILKANLYRELCHALGVPYNTGSVMMYRTKEKGFSYAAFDDSEVVSIELGKSLILI